MNITVIHKHCFANWVDNWHNHHLGPEMGQN